MKIIEVDNVTVKTKEKMILDKISFTIREGEIVGLIGPNGAGKSTTLKVLFGLVIPSNGSVKINGFDVLENPEKALKDVEGIVENPKFYENQTGLDNLNSFGILNGTTTNEIKKTAHFWGLDEKVLKRKVKKYSSGMLQKLALTKVFSSNPKLIILDEPTNALDPTSKIKFAQKVKEINEFQKTTFLISSHLLDEVEEICHKFIFIKEGKIVLDIAKNELTDNNIYILTLDKTFKKDEISTPIILKYLIESEENQLKFKIDSQEDLNFIIKKLIEDGYLIKEVKQNKKDLIEIYKELFYI